MPISHHWHGQDKTVLSCPCRQCELNWRQGDTVFSSPQYIWDWTVANWKQVAQLWQRDCTSSFWGWQGWVTLKQQRSPVSITLPLHSPLTARVQRKQMHGACHAHNNQKSRIYRISPVSCYKLCESTIRNTYLMYWQFLCRNRIFLSPFGSAALCNTRSSAVLRGRVTLRLNFRWRVTVRANI